MKIFGYKVNYLNHVHCNIINFTSDAAFIEDDSVKSSYTSQLFWVHCTIYAHLPYCFGFTVRSMHISHIVLGCLYDLCTSPILFWVLCTIYAHLPYCFGFTVRSMHISLIVLGSLYDLCTSPILFRVLCSIYAHLPYCFGCSVRSMHISHIVLGSLYDL